MIPEIIYSVNAPSRLRHERDHSPKKTERKDLPFVKQKEYPIV